MVGCTTECCLTRFGYKDCDSNAIVLAVYSFEILMELLTGN